MILILDLDRTLNILRPPSVRSIRELAPRALLERNGPALWKWIANHVSEVEYRVNERALRTVEALSASADAVIVNTGRPEAARAATISWLRRYFRVDLLLMRSDGDFRRTCEVKLDNYAAAISPLRAGRIAYAFDDNRSAVELYRREGVVAFTAPECWERLSAVLGPAGSNANIEAMLTRCARS